MAALINRCVWFGQISCKNNTSIFCSLKSSIISIVLFENYVRHRLRLKTCNLHSYRFLIFSSILHFFIFWASFVSKLVSGRVLLKVSNFFWVTNLKLCWQSALERFQFWLLYPNTESSFSFLPFSLFFLVNGFVSLHTFLNDPLIYFLLYAVHDFLGIQYVSLRITILKQSKTEHTTFEFFLLNIFSIL